MVDDDMSLSSGMLINSSVVIPAQAGQTRIAR